jgi:hypothetical protein
VGKIVITVWEQVEEQGFASGRGTGLSKVGPR